LSHPAPSSQCKSSELPRCRRPDLSVGRRIGDPIRWVPLKIRLPPRLAARSYFSGTRSGRLQEYLFPNKTFAAVCPADLVQTDSSLASAVGGRPFLARRAPGVLLRRFLSRHGRADGGLDRPCDEYEIFFPLLRGLRMGSGAYTGIGSSLIFLSSSPALTSQQLCLRGRPAPKLMTPN